MSLNNNSFTIIFLSEYLINKNIFMLSFLELLVNWWIVANGSESENFFGLFETINAD